MSGDTLGPVRYLSPRLGGWRNALEAGEGDGFAPARDFLRIHDDDLAAVADGFRGNLIEEVVSAGGVAFDDTLNFHIPGIDDAANAGGRGNRRALDTAGRRRRSHCLGATD